MNKLDDILRYLQFGASFLGGLTIAGAGVQGFAGIADKLLQIAQAAVKAHESITGQPLDMDKLHQITPIE